MSLHVVKVPLFFCTSLNEWDYCSLLFGKRERVSLWTDGRKGLVGHGHGEMD